MAVPTEIRCTTCGKATTTADRFCGFCGARLDAENATPTGEITGPHRPHVDRILAALRTATIGEYDVAGEIGRGGMAVVFLAHDLSLNRKVAIKALLPELLYTEGMDRRFKHEARIAAKLDHPNILVIHSVREANELLFIVMKLVEGLPLSTIAKVNGPLPIPVVRLIMRHVAEALAYAHGEGVVHRDIKPANIMVDRRGNVVVMDFGIAKAADDAHLTRTGLVIGTPAYMSPEQCLAQGVSSASDQYSLGVVAFELLTGKTPFRGSPLEMQWAHATTVPPTVRSLRADCPPNLDALVMRMLAKAPADRWASLHDVSHELSDDPTTAAAARTTLVALASDAPGQRDPALPTTPASPLPFGPGPAAVVDATTDPVRRTAAPAAHEPSVPSAPNASPVAGPMLTLSQQRIELTTGDSVELIVELDATEPSSDGTPITWQSSNPSVATVLPDGYVTALAPGFAEIGCTWQGKRAVCVVHVAAAVARPAIPALPPQPDAPSAARAARHVPAEMQEQPTQPSGTSRSRLVVGVVAAGIVGAFALYRVLGSEESPATTAALTPTTPTAAAPQPSQAPPAIAPPAAPSPLTRDSAPTGAERNTPGPDSATTPVATPPNATTAARSAQPRAATKTEVQPPRSTARVPSGAAATSDTRPRTVAGSQPAAPTVPLARVDSARLTANRTDTASGYGPARSTPATTPVPAPTYPAAPATRDSATDVPVPSREIANALFREFANVVNNRTYTRITAAYSQPSDPAEIKLWQEFLVFVRDYTPRATVRSTTVNTSTNPPTISASIDFRWSGDAGYERTRSASFVGIGLPITDGWQLRGVRLTKKFW